MQLFKHLLLSLKKLVTVLAIFISIIEIGKKTDLTPPLKRILYIYYPLWFNKNQAKIQALLNSRNVMTIAYAAKLGLKV